MDERKQTEPVYSSEPTRTTTVESPQAARESADSSGSPQTEQSSKQTQTMQTAALSEIPRKGELRSLAEFTQFLRRTWWMWLMVVVVILGLVADFTLAKSASEWARNAREKRHEYSVATVTPDALIARCGQPAQDVTREVFPILMRTMSYQPKGSEKLVASFSRTAEQQSDWVFLSIKDESGSGSYDTPEAKVAALPCLDLKK
jgi:hypothetical protein